MHMVSEDYFTSKLRELIESNYKVRAIIENNKGYFNVPPYQRDLIDKKLGMEVKVTTKYTQGANAITRKEFYKLVNELAESNYKVKALMRNGYSKVSDFHKGLIHRELGVTVYLDKKYYLVN